jgi:hypothetical protein
MRLARVFASLVFLSVLGISYRTGGIVRGRVSSRRRCACGVAGRRAAMRQARSGMEQSKNKMHRILV